MCDEITDGCEDCERLTGLVAALTAERDDLRSDAESLEGVLAKADNAAHACLDRAGCPLPFGHNFGEAALKLPAEFDRLTAERDALSRRVGGLEADVARFRAMERARWERAIQAFGPVVLPSRPVEEARP